MAEDNMSNLINSFKNMLHSDNSSNNTDSNNSSNTNLNITPEMIGNLANMLQSNTSNFQNASNTENSGSSAENNNSSNINSSFENKNSNNASNSLDFETILKIKSIMETLNKKDDPRSNLLYSLKPYLRENRQKKLDQYVNLLKITQVTNLFKNEKGDEN